jgi:hypothetical protein
MKKTGTERSINHGWTQMNTDAGKGIEREEAEKTERDVNLSALAVGRGAFHNWVNIKQ